MTSVVPLAVCLLLVRLLLNSWQWFSKSHRFSVAKVCRETERMVARGKKTHTTISLGIEWHCKTKKFKTQNQKHKSVFLTSFSFFFHEAIQPSSSPSPESKENHATMAIAIIHDQKKKTHQKTENRHIQKQTRVKKNNNNKIFWSLLLLFLCAAQDYKYKNLTTISRSFSKNNGNNQKQNADKIKI